MLFSYEWLQSFFNKKLPRPRELADLILARAFEVEGIEKIGKDWVLDINILSNRPDCLSHIGMAREIGAMLKIKPVIAKPKTGKIKGMPLAKSLVAVEIKDHNACFRYTGLAVTGTKIGPSPDWVARRLKACGLRPINNVVDVTNYIMLETGQPLHAFDWDKLTPGRGKAKKIIVRRANAGETIKTLEGKIHKLTPEMAVIADEAGPLAIAGIKGGKRAEIDKKSSNVVIEAANFDARTIRRASRALGLCTDASHRFEHNIDPNLTTEAGLRAAELIVKTGGGKILAGTADKYPRPVKAKKIVLNLEKAENLLGVPVQTAQVKKILDMLGFSSRKTNSVNFEITVPSRRADAVLAEDIVEEIGRMDGYEKIEAAVPLARITLPQKNYFWDRKNKIKDALSVAGYSETRNYSFVSEVDCQNFGLDVKNLLEVKNPVNEDLRYLRPTLLVNLLKNIAKNPECADLRQFEIGKVFATNLRMEPTMVGGFSLMSSFFEAKGALEFIFERLHIADFFIAPFTGEKRKSGGKIFDFDESAAIFAGKKEIGFLGRLSRKTVKNLGIAAAPTVFELNTDLLAEFASETVKYKIISPHPEALRDISVDVPYQTLTASVIDVIKETEGAELIKSIEIPDKPYNYPDKMTKNILIKFHLRSDEKTLSGEEIDDWQKNAIAAVERNPEWRVKKNLKLKNQS